jgi:cell division septation protein DedD
MRGELQAMSSKLIKGPGFGRSVPAVLQLPYPPEEILKTLTIILKADGTVEVMGAVGNLEFANHFLDAGRARLEQWHAQVEAHKAEQAKKTEAFLNGGEANVPEAHA